MAQFWFWCLVAVLVAQVGGLNAVMMYVATSLLMLLLYASTGERDYRNNGFE